MDQLVVDPGFGFGKTTKHNFQILRSLKAFQVLGLPPARWGKPKIDDLENPSVFARSCPKRDNRASCLGFGGRSEHFTGSRRHRSP